MQTCLERDCELQDLPLNELRSVNPLFDQDFYTCLTLESVLAIHDVPGGTAPARVRQAISRSQAKGRSHFRGSSCAPVRRFCRMPSRYTT